MGFALAVSRPHAPLRPSVGALPNYFADRFAGALVKKIANAASGTERLLAQGLWQFLPWIVGLAADLWPRPRRVGPSPRRSMGLSVHVLTRTARSARPRLEPRAWLTTSPRGAQSARATAGADGRQRP
jgi:hypothetical protein